MAAGYGNVHSIKSRGEYDSDNDASSSGIVNAAGLRASLQFDMRHLDLGGAFYTMVIGRNSIGFKWRSVDRNIRCNTRACS